MKAARISSRIFQSPLTGLPRTSKIPELFLRLSRPNRPGKRSILKAFLINKREFLLGLLENPNLIEHEKFSDLLWAIFHLTEELEYRTSVSCLSGPDLNHVEGDVGRLYGQLLYQWAAYVEHLQSKYPYLFSLTVRMSPFIANPSAAIT
jgi:hypothetical protein